METSPTGLSRYMASWPRGAPAGVVLVHHLRLNDPFHTNRHRWRTRGFQLVGMSQQLYGDRSTLSLLLTLAIPLGPQHGPPCSRQECLPRHTSTTATLQVLKRGIAFLSYSCRSLSIPYSYSHIRPSVHLMPGIARCATTDGSRERWKSYVVAHCLGLVSSFDFCTNRLCHYSHTLRAPRRRRNNVHKLGPDFHERKSNGYLEEFANVP